MRRPAWRSLRARGRPRARAPRPSCVPAPRAPRGHRRRGGCRAPAGSAATRSAHSPSRAHSRRVAESVVVRGRARRTASSTAGVAAPAARCAANQPQRTSSPERGQTVASPDQVGDARRRRSRSGRCRAWPAPGRARHRGTGGFPVRQPGSPWESVPASMRGARTSTSRPVTRTRPPSEESRSQHKVCGPPLTTPTRAVVARLLRSSVGEPRGTRGGDARRPARRRPDAPCRGPAWSTCDGAVRSCREPGGDPRRSGHGHGFRSGGTGRGHRLTLALPGCRIRPRARLSPTI